MKKLVVVAMIFLLGTAWWSTIDNFGVKKAEYRQHIAAAEKYEKQQIYYDAVLEYKNALEENPNQSELWIKIAQDYRNLGSDDEFEEPAIRRSVSRMINMRRYLCLRIIIWKRDEEKMQSHF